MRTIERLPAPIAGLSDREREALEEIVGLADDLSTRGDDRATVALAWARDLLAIKEG